MSSYIADSAGIKEGTMDNPLQVRSLTGANGSAVDSNTIVETMALSYIQQCNG